VKERTDSSPCNTLHLWNQSSSGAHNITNFCGAAPRYLAGQSEINAKMLNWLV